MNIVKVEFAGATLLGRIYKDQAYVAMKPIVEGMGLDWDRQMVKLRNHPVLAKQLTPIRGVVAGDGKNRQMLCLPHSRLPFWLATVNPSKVRADIREKVILFQEQAADVLAEAFLQNGKRQEVVKDKRIAGTIMCRVLQETMIAEGKVPHGYDFANEHRLVNQCITGVYGAVDEDALTTEQLKLQHELRMQNLVWIGQGKSYHHRKPLLEAHAKAWTAKQSLPRATRAISQEKAA
ncbi:MAG: phage antirepressor N-terminal domain-containing protein [Pseudomonas sp.]